MFLHKKWMRKSKKKTDKHRKNKQSGAPWHAVDMKKQYWIDLKESMLDASNVYIQLFSKFHTGNSIFDFLSLTHLNA